MTEFTSALEDLVGRLAEEKLFVNYQRPYDHSKPFGPDNVGPYDWQMEFHNAGADKTERLLIAGNRCVTPWTVIETVFQPRPILQLLRETAFDVHSWAGGLKCVERASGVFLKGIEPAFHVQMDSGQFFQCSRKHRVLTNEGWLSLDRLVRLSSGLRWKQTIEDYRANCDMDVRHDGQQPLSAEDTYSKQLPLKDGALKPARLFFSRADVTAHISRYTRASQEFVPPSIHDGQNQILGLCAMFEDPEPYIAALQRTGIHQEFLRCADVFCRQRLIRVAGAGQSSGALSGGAVNEFRAAANNFAGHTSKRRSLRQSHESYIAGQASLEFGHDAKNIEIFYPSEHTPLVGGNRIISIMPIGYQPIMDFTVENTACYLSGGVIHHNTGKTQTAAAEIACHLTGLYPDWWPGRKFTKPVVMWCCSESWTASRDIIQNALLGPVGEEGTGWIPKEEIIDWKKRQAGVADVVETIRVKHKSGGVSSATLKTYEQQRKEFMGRACDGVWFDEEPPMDIYTEGLTRILDKRGFVMVTFTNLQGATEVVRHFVNPSEGSNTYLKSAGWDSAPHLDEKMRAELIASYPAREIDARTKGAVMMGAGSIFSVPDEEIMVAPFQIPDHYARINGIDFGIGHPAATVWCAVDRESKTFYVYDCYKRANETALYHATALKKHGDWIPTAWPHDGIQRDKGTGLTLKDQYRDHGAYMLPKHAQFEDNKRGTSREAGLDLMDVYMLTGRFKVFSSLSDWFEEKRMYHRKIDKDGESVVVAQYDDILSATRYAFMMRRYAKTKSFTTAKSKRPSRPIVGGQSFRS